jgi:YD repeat-containing protein
MNKLYRVTYNVLPQLAGISCAHTSNMVLDTLQTRQGSTATLLFDFKEAPANKLYKLRNFFAGISIPGNGYGITAKSLNQLFVPSSGSQFMGWLFIPATDPFSPDPTMFGGAPNAFSFSAPVTDSLWLGNGYMAFKRYEVVAPSGITADQVSRNTGIIHHYIAGNLAPYLFYNSRLSTMDEDYMLADKKAFLSYTYYNQQKPAYMVLDTLQLHYLEQLGQYQGKGLSYSRPFRADPPVHLYIADPNVVHDNFTGKLVYVLDQFAGSAPPPQLQSPFAFPEPGNDSTWTINPDLKGYYCSDGSYWYRYFGPGDTLYNIFVRLPEYLPRSQHRYCELVGIKPLPGEGASSFFELSLKLGDDILKAQGMTDFIIAHNEVLEDVLLSGNTTTRQVQLADTFNHCERYRLTFAIYEGKYRYRSYIDSVRNHLRTAFMDHMIQGADEELHLGYRDQRFLYTLYYYDRAGNLMRTVPPEGVQQLAPATLAAINTARQTASLPAPGQLPQHQKASDYSYNSINQIAEQVTPDGGTTRFFYDKAGRLVFSQNDKQLPQGYYTYNLYDAQGRIIETGQAQLGCPYFPETPYKDPNGVTLPPPAGISCYHVDNNNNVYTSVPNVIRLFGGMPQDQINSQVRAYIRKDVVLTVYDTMAADFGLVNGMSRQQHLRKRVAAIFYYESLAAGTAGLPYFSHATHYSYDISGNVKTLIQEFPALAQLGHRYKRVDYDYDLVSGKVNMLSYNRSFADQYYQRYSYDDDNRIVQVETSQDGYLWKRDASYQYYQHGPLARASIGDLRVQGIDYAYTIQGWLKAVNGDMNEASLDMGLDGVDANSVYARDAVAGTIDYFKGDYKSLSGRPVSHVGQPAGMRNLYNGNIARQTTAILPFQTLHKKYVYDQLNRISTTAYDAVAPVTAALTQLPDYANSYEYDQDGNLLKLKRTGNNNGVGAQPMDRLSYYYTPGSNRLRQVTDSASNIYTNDITQFTDPATTRFLYDATGNTIKDLTAGQDTINWNLYNKVTRTENRLGNNALVFGYDGAGNRTSKRFSQGTDTGKIETSEYYVRDATGNVLAAPSAFQMSKGA